MLPSVTLVDKYLYINGLNSDELYKKPSQNRHGFIISYKTHA